MNTTCSLNPNLPNEMFQLLNPTFPVVSIKNVNSWHSLTFDGLTFSQYRLNSTKQYWISDMEGPYICPDLSKTICGFSYTLFYHFILVKSVKIFLWQNFVRLTSQFYFQLACVPDVYRVATITLPVRAWGRDMETSYTYSAHAIMNLQSKGLKKRYCSARSKLKLNTKIGLHTTTHPPQTFLLEGVVLGFWNFAWAFNPPKK